MGARGLRMSKIAAMTTTITINPTTIPTMTNTTGGMLPLGLAVVASALGRRLVRRLTVVGLFGVDFAGVGLAGVEDAVLPLVAVEIVGVEVFVVELAEVVVFAIEVVGFELVVVELNGVEVFVIEVVAVDLVDVEFVRLIPSGWVLVAEMK